MREESNTPKNPVLNRAVLRQWREIWAWLLAAAAVSGSIALPLGIGALVGGWLAVGIGIAWMVIAFTFWIAVAVVSDRKRFS